MKEIAKRIYNKYPSMTRKSSEEIVKDVISSLKQELKEKRSLRIKDFGTFEVRTKKQVNRRNPRTGEPVVIPERDKVFFREAKNILVEEINDGNNDNRYS